jgi:hypothetical protein
MVSLCTTPQVGEWMYSSMKIHSQDGRVSNRIPPHTRQKRYRLRQLSLGTVLRGEESTVCRSTEFT